MPDWLADPTECVTREDPHYNPCKILVDRNVVMSRPTKLVHTENAHGADLYHFGHLSAIRKGDKVRLTVNTSPTQSFSTPALSPQEALYASDCLRAASANTGASACAGKSINELLWDDLDALMDILMDPEDADETEHALTRGKAEGVARALAVFQNPYLPNLDAIRTQAMDRWEERTS